MDKDLLLFTAIGFVIGLPVGVLLAWYFLPPPVAQTKKMASNVELWEYTDHEGRKRTIEVHRKFE